MVEQDAVAGVHAVGFAVVDRDPVGVELGHGVGAARVKRRGFFLRGFLHQAVKFGGAGLVEAGFLLQPEDANGFQNAQCAHAVDVGGVFGALKADRHMGLSAEVVDFVWLRFLNDAGQVAAVAQVAVVQLEAGVVHMQVLVEVVYALSVERTGPAFDTVDCVAFVQQEFGQVRTVLAGDASDECGFGGGYGANSGSI